MKRVFALVLALVIGTILCSTAALAQTHGMTIPAGHPRLWWTPARIAAAQAWLASHPFTPSSDDWLGIAFKHIVHGDDCSSAITDALGDIVPSDEWNPNSNGADVARWAGDAGIFVVFDWCYDQWSAGQKTTFINNWNTWLNGIRQQRWGGVGMEADNYYWGNLTNELEFGIVTYGENASAETFINSALTTRWTDSFLPFAASTSEGKGLGGVMQEGTEYGAVIVAYPFRVFQSAQFMGRDVLNESRFFRDATFWIIYATLPALTYNVKDGGATVWEMFPFNDDEIFEQGGILARRSYYQNWMNFASNYWSGVNVGKYARTWVNTVGAATSTYPYVLAMDASPSALAYSGLPLDFYGHGAQFFYGRKAWDSSSTVVNWQMGRAEGIGHIHMDWGNFQIWRGGRWLARETSGYSENFTGGGTADSIAHNIVRINNNTNGYFGDLEAGNSAGPPVVNRLESAAAYAYADVDLTASYNFSPDYSGCNASLGAGHVEREFLFIRPLETQVILDRITSTDRSSCAGGVSAAAAIKTFVTHCETSPTVNNTNHTVTCTHGTQVLRTTTLVPATTTYTVTDEGGAIGQYRISLNTSGDAQRYFLHVMQASAAADAALTASVVDSNPASTTTGTYTVTLHPASGSDTTIVFNKGATSSGGTVAIAGGSPVALRSNVQGFTVTDNGPVWAGGIAPAPPAALRVTSQ